MSTLKEISTSKHANRLYHNGQIKFRIALIREYDRLAAGGSDLYKRLASIYRSTLIKHLTDRRNYKYL